MTRSVHKSQPLNVYKSWSVDEYSMKVEAIDIRIAVLVRLACSLFILEKRSL